jgi:CheY-like chemotaxis protein
MNHKNTPVNVLPVRGDQDDCLMEYKYLQSLCLMTRGVTHDYNNIFTGLSGQLKLIVQEANLGGIAENRMQMVNDLLARGENRTSILYEFSRYTHSEKRDHSLDRILELAVKSLNILSRSHQFVAERHGELPRLRCSLKDIVMMLFYLGENGLEATPEGGTIKVVAECNPNREMAVVFSVRNKGRGISPEVHASLFQPFVTTKTSDQGLRGLGLYAAQNIVRQHGGTMFFTDDRGGETVFSAIIPLPQQEEASVILHNSEVVAPEIRGKKEIGRKRETFFVVEDDEAMRDLIVSSLQRRGHVVFSAETCSEALEDFELLHEAVTVLLIDIGLTDSDGFECMKKMSTISSQVKMIFMSGEDVGKQEISRYDAAFLKKPFTVKEIEELVNDHE